MRAKRIYVTAAVAVLGSAAHAIDLETLYRAALSRNEAIQRAESRARAEEGRRGAVEAEYYPALSASYSLLRQTELPDPFARSIFPAEQQTAKLSASLNLYNGGATRSRQRAVNWRVAASRLSAEAQKIALYKNLARSYFSLAAATQEQRIVAAQISLQKSFREKLAAARSSGRIRSSAFLSVDSSLLSREAELIRLEQRAREGWTRLLSESGLPSAPGEIDAERELAKLPTEADLSTLESWTSRVSASPELRSLSSEQQAADSDLEGTISGYLPRLDLSANYYLQRPPGIAQDLRWDAGLTLSIPLFDGFKTAGVRATAVSELRGATLKTAQTLREKVAEKEILYTQIKLALAQLEKVTKAHGLATKAADNLNESFSAGLATELEVLSANDAVFELQRTKARLSADIRTAWTELSETSASDLPQTTQDKP